MLFSGSAISWSAAFWGPDVWPTLPKHLKVHSLLGLTGLFVCEQKAHPTNIFTCSRLPTLAGGCGILDVVLGEVPEPFGKAPGWIWEART